MDSSHHHHHHHHASSTAAPEEDSKNLSVQLKTSTKEVHRTVETSGIMRNLMRNQLPLTQYIHLLRALYTIYVEMEAALDKNASHPVIELIHFPRELRRLETLRQDILFLTHSKGDVEPCTCSHVVDFANRIRWVGENEPTLLPAYSYVRYLGDLSGGQFLSKRIGKAYGLTDQGLAFYAFDSITDIEHFKTVYKNGMDQIPEAFHEGILKETYESFLAHGRFFGDMNAEVPCSGGFTPMVVNKVECAFAAPWLADGLRAHGIGHVHLLLGVALMGLAAYAA